MAYQDGDILVRVIMEATSGLVEDQIVNDFAFSRSLEPSEAQLLEVFDKIDKFYNSVEVDANALAGYMSTVINRSATHRMDFYKIQTGDLGAPIWSEPWLGPGGALGTGNLPNEVAAVLSFHGELGGLPEEFGAIRPRARRRGRIYLGPLRDNAITAVGSAPPKLSSAFRDDMANAANVLRLKNETSWGDWSVWSRSGEQLHAIVGGWTDDAIDSQRRRGAAATARATWGFGV